MRIERKRSRQHIASPRCQSWHTGRHRFRVPPHSRWTERAVCPSATPVGLRRATPIETRHALSRRPGSVIPTREQRGTGAGREHARGSSSRTVTQQRPRGARDGASVFRNREPMRACYRGTVLPAVGGADHDLASRVKRDDAVVDGRDGLVRRTPGSGRIDELRRAVSEARPCRTVRVCGRRSAARLAGDGDRRESRGRGRLQQRLLASQPGSDGKRETHEQQTACHVR